MVVMDKQDYTDKALSPLTDTNTYRTINKDPTIKLTNQLINTFKNIKHMGGLNDSSYKKGYPASAVPPSFMASPKLIRLPLPQAHCVQQGFHHLWGGKGVGRHHPPLGRPVSSPPQKYIAFCGTHKTSKTGTRGNQYIL